MVCLGGRLVRVASMWQMILACCALTSGVVVFSLDEIIAKGKWLVENINKCPDPEQYPFDVDVQRKKVNRTHDGFFGKLNLKEEVNDDFGINLEVCIKVDGGCKLVQVLVDPSFCDFIMRYSADNFGEVLHLAGLLVADCPIPAGTYEVDNYMFDYSELPKESMLGKFQATAYLTRGGDNVGCVMTDFSFDKSEDDDDEE